MLDRLTIERMDAAAGKGPIIVALSGGGDSTALLHLLAERLGASRLLAGIVDHALRLGSADDAARAAESAERAGVAARVLTLAWDEGDNRSQGAARERRYRALCDLARAADAHVIAVGHTRDDQAETVLMRAARSAGWRGLVGMRAMAPAPVWPEGRGIWLARPLLLTRRVALRDWLKVRDLAWLDDPANDNTEYERIVARRALAQAEGFDPMRLASIAERLAPRAAAIDGEAAALTEQAARFDGDTITIACAAWEGAENVRARALWALIAAASGQPFGPSHNQARALEAQASSKRPFKGATLGGARLQRRAREIVITRDTGALTGRADGAKSVPALPLPANIETVWDGRVALSMARPGWSVVFENGAPGLARGEERAQLSAAAPNWLLETRVRHLLALR
jgi:tRNA(Ile)-lysidine synthase